jgi:uncharacterized protein
MAIRYDPAKNNANIAKRGLSFDRVAEIDFTTSVHGVDCRRDYGETRQIMVGHLDGRLHIVCYTWREGDVMHVISFRKANAKEARKYGKPQTIDE